MSQINIDNMFNKNFGMGQRIITLGSSVILTLVLTLYCQTPVLARDNVSDWYIKDFQTEIQVNKDSSLDITEKILADCGTATDKHGIFRILPTKYQTKNGNFILPTELISIIDAKGQPLKYLVSKNGDTVTYKIGDPNVDVQGENFYEIKYHVKNAIRTKSANFDEFYWNVLGNYWDLEIDNFTIKINFPVGINKDNSSLNNYSGKLGSKAGDLAAYQWTSNTTLVFTSQRTAKVQEGLTVSLTFPKNIITPYQLTFADKYSLSLLAMVVSITISFLLIIISYIFSLRLWKKYGRDPRLNKTITPEFEIPENLSPIEMGGIIKRGGLHGNAITATIIRLGVMGYLTIEKIEQQVLLLSSSTFKLSRTNKPIGTDLYEAENYVLGFMFPGTEKEILLKDLGPYFQNEQSKISELILVDLDKRGLVGKKGKELKIKMIVLGIALLSSGLILILISVQVSIQLLFMISGVFFSGLIVLIFGLLMAKRTPAGAELNWRIKGFRLYMETAEKYRSRWQERTNQLEKFLPYAILFGITTEWLEKMKDIYGEKYLANYHPVFMVGALSAANFSDFTSTINQISTDINSYTSPSSSGAYGGGFSGGGGGGGGGGGW